jgi:hypothetical protein
MVRRNRHSPGSRSCYRNHHPSRSHLRIRRSRHRSSFRRMPSGRNMSDSSSIQ